MALLDGVNFNNEGNRMDLIILGIGIFNVALGGALQAEETTHSDFRPYMHIGGQVNASDATMGGGGFIYKDKLDFNITYIAEGDTNWGKHESMRVVSISRIVTPGWFGDTLFLGVGYANVQDTELVGQHNFELKIGGQWDWGRIYYNHISDFDIGTNNNSGLDGLHISFDLSF